MKQIAKNNYDGDWESNMESGRTKVAFQLKMPRSKVRKAEDIRDVWLYTDGYLKLEKYHTGAVMGGTMAGNYDREWYLQ